MKPFLFFLLALSVTMVACGGAAPMPPAPPTKSSAMVSFTVDDNHGPSWQTTFAAKGAVGTSYVITGPTYSSPEKWTQELALQSAGWEIGSHSRTHPHLPTLDSVALESELGGSQADLAAHGISATNFAYPYGDANPAVRTVASKYYVGSRTVANQLNYRPFPLNCLNAYDGDANTLATLENSVDLAIARDGWLVIVLHEYETAKAQKISDLIDYIEARSLPILTMSEAESVAK